MSAEYETLYFLVCNECYESYIPNKNTNRTCLVDLRARAEVDGWTLLLESNFTWRDLCHGCSAGQGPSSKGG